MYLDRHRLQTGMLLKLWLCLLTLVCSNYTAHMLEWHLSVIPPSHIASFHFRVSVSVSLVPILFSFFCSCISFFIRCCTFSLHFVYLSVGWSLIKYYLLHYGELTNRQIIIRSHKISQCLKRMKHSNVILQVNSTLNDIYYKSQAMCCSNKQISQA